MRARRLAYDGAIYGRSEFTVMRYPTERLKSGAMSFRGEQILGRAEIFAFTPSQLHFFPEAQAPEAPPLILLSLRYSVPRSERSSGRETAVPGL